MEEPGGFTSTAQELGNVISRFHDPSGSLCPEISFTTWRDSRGFQMFPNSAGGQPGAEPSTGCAGAREGPEGLGRGQEGWEGGKILLL